MRTSTLLFYTCSLALLCAAGLGACSDDPEVDDGAGGSGAGPTSSTTGAAGATGTGASGAQGGGGTGAVGGQGGAGGAGGSGGAAGPGGAGGSGPGGAGGSGGAAGPGGAGGAGGGGGTGGGNNASGDCTTDADCPGGTCQPITQGGFKVCVIPPVEATMCQGAFDDCCTTADCVSGTCYETPITPFCGGVQMIPHNECASDQCVSDVDCRGNGICVPAGALGYKVKACIIASCKVDADCMDEPGAICAPVTEPCCGGPAGVFCVYPSDGCRNDGDCPGGYCTNDGLKSFCEPGNPTCPL